MTTFTLTKDYVFKEPKWSVAQAKPGQEVELGVTAKDLLPGQSVQFLIRSNKGPVLSHLEAKPDTHKQKWIAPNTPGEAKYHFYAILREKPSVANGHLTIQRMEKSDDLTVKGTRVTITSIDEAFVPKQEKLEVEYKLEGAAPAKGRFEVWGERYPTDKPLYTEEFTPATGEKEWKTWDGKSNDGKKYLNSQTADAYLTPEFSPYRLRIIVGPDDDAVKDPLGKGLGKVAMAEQQFEIAFQSVWLRLQAGLAGGVKTDLDKLLAVEPRTPKDIYAAVGRLPLETEPALANNWTPGQGAVGARAGVGRILIPTVRHTVIGESLGQGQFSGWSVEGNAAAAGPIAFTVPQYPTGEGVLTVTRGGVNQVFAETDSTHVQVTATGPGKIKISAKRLPPRVSDPYLGANDNPPGGAGQTKYQIDQPIYTRPEIPVEIEARLRSRLSANNTDVTKKGLFEKTAVGPALFEIHVDEVFHSTLFSTAGTPQSRLYLRNAHTRVKRGVHDRPQNDAGKAIVSHWLARLKVANDGDQEFDVSAAYNAGAPDNLTDPVFSWAAGKAKDELTVYLNRTRLEPAQTDDEFDKGYKDFKEVDTKKIKLRKGLTRKDDILWIARADSAAPGPDKVATWRNYPLGTNCPVHYGGIRGQPPTDDLLGTLRKDYSGGPTGSEPILGKAAPFPYKDAVNLDPAKVSAALREATESQAVTAQTDQQGLAGIIFSPSVVAGDGYVLEASLRGCPYDRSLGCVTARPEKPWAKGRTGQWNVWRQCTMAESYVGGGVVDNALNTRTHPGDGKGMNVNRLNTLVEAAFNEWVVPPQVANGDPHRQVDKTAYRNAINGLNGTGDGAVTLNADGQINGEFIRWDHFRVQLPPHIEPDRINACSNAIAALPARSSSSAAQIAVKNALDALNVGVYAADPALTAPAALPVYPGSVSDYGNWVDGKVDNFTYQMLDALLGTANPPRSMKAIRWPNGYQRFWNDGDCYHSFGGGWSTTTLGTAGAVRGSGQSYYYTVGGNLDTFEHEMGHSLHLVHFSAGNCGWKHHDLNYVICIMSYYSGDNYIPKPTGAVGTWPDVDPATGGAAIRLFTNNNRDQFCAKCFLKMRGWKEDVLPCAWDHPGLF